MLKAANTYEIMSPETIGLVRADAAGIVLGKHSGRHALGTRLKALGYDLQKEQLVEVFARFKELADKKTKVEDEDLAALVGDELRQGSVLWAVESLQVMCGTAELTTATIKLRGPDGIRRVGTSTGSGPVDAAYRAIDSLVAAPCQLKDYSITSVTDGIDAQANTRVLIEPLEGLKGGVQVKRVSGSVSSRMFQGSGSHVDIVVASARAYVAALNKMIAYISQQQDDETNAAQESIDTSADDTAQPEPEPVAN